MNLLFDQNISFRIISKLEDIFPNAKQVKDVGLADRSDLEIWNFAKNNNYCIVTFDSDFYDLSCPGRKGSQHRELGITHHRFVGERA